MRARARSVLQPNTPDEEASAAIRGDAGSVHSPSRSKPRSGELAARRITKASQSADAPQTERYTPTARSRERRRDAPKTITESQLAAIWRGRRFPAGALVTRHGVPVT